LRWKAAVLGASILGLSTVNAVAVEAVVNRNAQLRWGPGAEYPIQVVVPAGSIFDVKECGRSWCLGDWEGYEGFIARWLLSFGGVSVPYIAVFADYDYYGGYIYGPSFGFRLHGGFHSRRESRAAHHTRAESRAERHSRKESRAERHTRAESRRAADIRRRKEAAPVIERRRHRIERRREFEKPRIERRRIERPKVQRRRIERPQREIQRQQRRIQRQQIQREKPRGGDGKRRRKGDGRKD
jgi:uncharacterized protein YraI